MTALRVDAVFDTARAHGVDRLDAQLLLGHLLGVSRAWLAAHGDSQLGVAQAAACRAMLARRGAGEPLAYVIGEATFCGLRLGVTPAVLIPRPETEEIVRWALELAVQAPAGDAVDLGTGSGAIALAIASALARGRASAPLTDATAAVPAVAPFGEPGVDLPGGTGALARRVCASDASPAALAVARANGERLALSVEWAQGDWWAAWPGRRFALAVANPPYVDAGDPHLAALAHEPQQALTPGDDSLSALRAIVEGASASLLPGAWLLLEHGHDQAQGVRTMLEANGFDAPETRLDLAGLPRCTGARRPGID